MTSRVMPSSSRWCSRRFAAALGALLLLIALLVVAPYLWSGTELVRLRNAIALGPELTQVPAWRPGAEPADYRVDSPPLDPYFVDVVRRLALHRQRDHWDRARAIASHLLGSAPALNGGPAHQDLRHTYESIVQRGDGYCGDFIRVFQAIANAAGLHVRPLSFSFDGFGGHGHIWVEIWRPAEDRWLLMDVYNNQYVTDAGGRVLGAMELKRALDTLSVAERRPEQVAAATGLRIVRIEPRVRFYGIEEKAWEYYLRGLDEWFVPWGNNVMEVDRHWTTRLFTGRSRALEQGTALLADVQPRIRIVAQPRNTEARDGIAALRLRMIAAMVAAVVGIALCVLALLLPGRVKDPSRAQLLRGGRP